ncbi:FMN-binding protein [Thiorhodococcus mannitoliphagus]|uniref:Ion-translocating oxidoreductase complex subunit G n=1 Tax=Thiorhodococcus mannitoliphagus TaxID=329406 RepID=A0A6P1DXC1_9GAMM|nr:FMN-binding protein [Thiorhodococcus mannitoliphagus]NEX21631.1 FMN-binding protein [Thiorhodococcus mannitoliphagus]
MSAGSDQAAKASHCQRTEPSSTRLVATLSIAGLLSGLIIVSVYEATLPTITAYQAKMLREAVFKVLPEIDHIQRLVYADGTLAPKDAEEPDDEAVFGGYDARGGLVGYAIPSAGPGFQDTIHLLYGYVPAARMVTGMEILESRETPGLGDKIYKDQSFVDEFARLAVAPEIRAVKKGTATAPNEVDAITGATISSKAVVRIINEGNQRWLSRLPASSAQPQAERRAVPEPELRQRPSTTSPLSQRGARGDFGRHRSHRETIDGHFLSAASPRKAAPLNPAPHPESELPAGSRPLEAGG